MASVLFSAVGQAVGGPLGAGVGAAVGGSLDAALGGRGRRAAVDGYIQRSAYGEGVPRLFGRVRVAGQVIWAQPPEPMASAKGSGRQAVRASLAVALCSGPVRDVGRIWADGREFRDAEGQTARPLTMRLWQAPNREADPLIAAAEGADAPAFRGLSYVVIEGLELEPFGNRIPSFSFEVVADEGGVADWLDGLGRCRGVAAEEGGAVPALTGYAAAEGSWLEDMGILARLAGQRLALSGGSATFRPEGRLFRVAPGDLLADARAEAGELQAGAPETWRAPPVPGVALGYLDAGRDYQLGEQRAGRAEEARRAAFSWPVAAEAGVARNLAARLLRESRASAERMRMALPLSWLDISVGDRVQLGEDAPWHVVRREIRADRILLEGEAVAADGRAPVGDAGRFVPAPVMPVPGSVLLPFEAPVPIAGEAGGVLVTAGGGAGWRGADIRLLEGGTERALGRVEAGLPFGRLRETLAPGPATSWDEANSLLLEVAPGAEPLGAVAALEVLSGANLLLVGRELLQFREGAWVAPGLVRLRGLLRGRFGTSPDGAIVGTAVAGVPRSGCPLLPAAADQAGRLLQLLAVGRGDPVGGTAAAHVMEGAWCAPLAPCHLRAERVTGGDVRFGWSPRGREAWEWSGSGGADMGAAVLIFRADDGRTFEMPVAGTGLLLTMAEQVERLGGPLPPGAFAIEMLGDGPLAVRRSGWRRI